MTKQLLFHIGLPKCASTTVQAIVASHPDIDYYGFIPKNDHYYKDPVIGKLFDRVGRFSCSNKEFYHNYLSCCIKESTSNTVFFSSENISLRFLPWDLPTHIKFEFFSQIFPSNTIFLVNFRNPIHLLKSLYKEWVLLGYDKNFNRFTNELFTFKDISFFRDICLGRFLANFNKYFNLDNLFILFIDEDDWIDHFCSLLQIPLQHIKKNISISDLETQIIQAQNKKNRDFSSFFDRIELHRAFPDIDNKIKFSTSRKRVAKKASAKALKKHYSIDEQFFTQSDDTVLKYIITDLESAKIKLKNNQNSINTIDNYISSIKEYL